MASKSQSLTVGEERENTLGRCSSYGLNPAQKVLSHGDNLALRTSPGWDLAALLWHECIPPPRPCPIAHPVGIYLSLTSSSLEKGTGEKSSLVHFVLDIQGFGTQKASHTFLVFNETFDSTPKIKAKILFYFKKHNSSQNHFSLQLCCFDLRWNSYENNVWWKR